MAVGIEGSRVAVGGRLVEVGSVVDVKVGEDGSALGATVQVGGRVFGALVGGCSGAAGAQPAIRVIISKRARIVFLVISGVGCFFSIA